MIPTLVLKPSSKSGSKNVLVIAVGERKKNGCDSLKIIGFFLLQKMPEASEDHNHWKAC